MSSVSPSQVEVGHTLPTLCLPAVDRTMLALFAGASGDHVPLHIDTDFARRAGMPDVFAHGMLGMAWVGRLITEWAPQSALRSLSVRFVAITHLGNQPVLTGKVVELLEQEGERRARLEVQMANQYGQIKILGEALVALA
ncbi:MAG: MaoC/PaaZ C-terminal domain-containing protein [Sinimarinibacterium flocculans]|uniref:MaoC/PaaZ C-terminal domain-containing protein n=1 Tax=Sinimarinibacterium flocculans TaxID=985250 RepID=UPI002491BCD2|nr:MaoC/PaaZ C-terminal domain-containing protein [Sinimarinibacterium flocculans]